MHREGLTDAEISTLAAQIDAELRELGDDDTIGVHKAERRKTGVTLPEKQMRAIEAATGEPADRFLDRFKRAARKDLCQQGGLLYTQWQKFQDFQKKDIVKVFYGVLTGMGIEGTALPGLVVATGVIVMNIIFNIGISAICDDGKNE